MRKIRENLLFQQYQILRQLKNRGCTKLYFDTPSEIPVIDDEDVLGEIEYDMFNPDIDIMPPIEPEHKKYDKLNKEEKAALKELWIDIVIRYWEDERLIPFGEPYSKIKRELLDIFIDRGEIALKDDNSLKVVLHDTMIVTINKILKRENQK